MQVPLQGLAPGEKELSLLLEYAVALTNAACRCFQSMLCCSPRSQGGCLKKGEVYWQDSVARSGLFTLFPKPLQ